MVTSRAKVASQSGGKTDRKGLEKVKSFLTNAIGAKIHGQSGRSSREICFPVVLFKLFWF